MPDKKLSEITEVFHCHAIVHGQFFERRNRQRPGGRGESDRPAREGAR